MVSLLPASELGSLRRKRVTISELALLKHPRLARNPPLMTPRVCADVLECAVLRWLYRHKANRATPARVTACGAAPRSFSFDEETSGADTPAGPEASDLRAEHAGGGAGDDGSGGGED